MRFLFRILPTILLILLIAVIYFGGKKVITFVNENKDAYEASLVTENFENGIDNETSSVERGLADVSKNKLNTNKKVGNNDKSSAKKDIEIDDSDFEDDLEEANLANPEATLDAELEGKSSNQLIASNTEKAKKLKDKTAVKSTSEKKNIVKKTNEKPSINKFTAKGNVPTSYDLENNKEQFMVIAGSFKSKANANIFIDDLEKKGLKDIEIIELKNKSLNRVCISRHASYENAKQVISQLKKNFKVDAYVHRTAN